MGWREGGVSGGLVSLNGRGVCFGQARLGSAGSQRLAGRQAEFWVLAVQEILCMVRAPCTFSMHIVVLQGPANLLSEDPRVRRIHRAVCTAVLPSVMKRLYLYLFRIRMLVAFGFYALFCYQYMTGLNKYNFYLPACYQEQT